MISAFYYLPASYYFESRFPSFHSGLIYFIKYWFSYLVPFTFISGLVNAYTLFTITLSIVSFYSLYDIFVYVNDKVAIKNEGSSLIKRAGGIPYSLKYIVIKSLLSLFIIFYSFYIIGSYLYLFSMVMIGIVFYFHNNIRAEVRPITFFLLYFLKPLCVGGFLIEQQHLDLLFLFSFLYALAYLPNYYKRKVVGRLSQFLKSLPRYITSGIILKNVFILPILIIDQAFIYFYFIQIFFTVSEVFINKYQGVKV